jgi:ketosteroid isomerase-like protein
MSPNLDLVRSIYAAWERGDFSQVEWANPDIEYEYADGPSPGRWKGLDGMAEGFREWLSSWEDFRLAVDEYRELDGERVIVLDRLTGHGKISGLEMGQMQTKTATLFRIRDGRVTGLIIYWDRKRALADLGLAPEGG